MLKYFDVEPILPIALPPPLTMAVTALPLLIVSIPDAVIDVEAIVTPDVSKFPPVTLPVAVTRPAVVTLPPLTLPVTVAVVVAEMLPVLIKLAPEIFPVAVTLPPVVKFPPVMVPDTPA